MIETLGTPANGSVSADVAAVAAAIANIPAGVASMLIAAGLAQYVEGDSGPLQWTAVAWRWAGEEED